MVTVGVLVILSEARAIKADLVEGGGYGGGVGVKGPEGTEVGVGGKAGA